MPKIIDPDARRRAVAQALFRVVVRAGVAGVSLRTVAAEAELAIGSVRHYFDGHEELMIFAQQALTEAVQSRMTVHLDTLRTPGRMTPEQRLAVVESLLAELLPIDEPRRREAIVWLEFTTAARTDATLRPYARELATAMRTMVRKVLDGMARGSHLRDGLDLELETRRFCALLDGIMLAAVLTPEQMPPEAELATLRRHLDTLTTGIPTTG